VSPSDTLAGVFARRHRYRDPRFDTRRRRGRRATARHCGGDCPLPAAGPDVVCDACGALVPPGRVLVEVAVLADAVRALAACSTS
jgi:hypothetical protein